MRHDCSITVLGAVLTAGLLGACLPAHRHGGEHATYPDWVRTQPRLVVEGKPHWTKGFDAAYRVALRNLHEPNAYYRTRHARAAPAIRGVHLWDSAFLSHIWKVWDVQISQQINLAVLEKSENGRLPHFSHRILRSDFTQPPVLAWSVWENFLWSGDTSYLAGAYRVLNAYDLWLRENRRLPSGLFFWASALESGKDNSPRFDSPIGRRQRDLRTVAAVDLSSYVAHQSSVLARMAEVLGYRKDRSAHEARAVELRGLINELLWDEVTGFYFDRDERNGELVKVRTTASFLPLFAEVPDTTRARRLRDHIMNPSSFHSLIPLPTVARDDPAYAKDMWRGPVWINVSYLIIRGLAAYGYHEEAAALSFATVDGVFATYDRTEGVWEFYDAERFDIAHLERKRGKIFKRITLGNKPLPHYGWSALVNTLVVEHLVGFRREGGRAWVEPRLPPAAAGLRLWLSLPGEGLTIRVEARLDGRVRGEVGASDYRETFVLSPGESYEVPVRRAVARGPDVPAIERYREAAPSPAEAPPPAPAPVSP